jgi:hypothetical protein
MTTLTIHQTKNSPTKVNDFMLMAKEDFDYKSTGSDVNDEEVVVEMEGELINALEEIPGLIFKKKKKKTIVDTVRERQ